MQQVPVVTIFAVLLAVCSSVTALEANNGPEERIGKVPEVGVESTVPVPVLPVLTANEKLLLMRAVAPGEFSVKSIDEQELPSSIKENTLERVRLMREHKVIPVSDQQIPEDFAAAEADYRARKTPLRGTQSTIAFSPANVDATSLRGQTLVGAIPSGGYVNNSWTGLSRMFHHPDLGYVVLEETDLTKDGGGVVFTKEMINADVNGAPAVLESRQGSARSITSLTWFSNGVSYSLRTPRVDDKSRDELLNIARGLGK